VIGDSYEITRLTLTNFRSYGKLNLSRIDAKNVIITGPNGAGKTNILEALSMFSPAGPFRRASLPQLGKIGGKPPVFTVFANVRAGGEESSLGLSYNYDAQPGGADEEADAVAAAPKTIVANDADIGASELPGYVRVVWVTPLMDRLFSETGGERRKFLDGLMSNFYPFYGASLNSYSNLLKQRAKVLKGRHPDAAWLDGIEREIAAEGVAIAASRLEFEEKLNAILAGARGRFPNMEISVEGFVEDRLRRAKAVDAEDFFRDSLKSNRGLFRSNFSPPVEGPHRSDFSAFNLAKGISAGQTSTGEQKMSVVSIILAYANMLRLYFGRYPVVLLDEAPAHLDGERLGDLFRELEDMPLQVWMSGIDAADFGFFGPGNSLFLKVRNSELE
jgi:DNA replication and repair protein RecF